MALTSLLAQAAEGTKLIATSMTSSFLSQLVLDVATKENAFTAHRFSDPVSQCFAAMLVVVAAATGTGWEHVLGVLGALSLPALAMHSSAYTAFQCLNALGIYRALNSTSDAWTTATCIFMHLYLVLANLDNRSQQLLDSIVQKVTYRQERRLVALCRLRELTLADIWVLPERFSLRSAYSEFTYNKEEPLFLIRAILRMTWRPMIPIYIAESLLNTVSVLTTTLNSAVLHCLDSPATSTWYKGYVTMLLLVLVKALEMQNDQVSKYSSAETNRVSGAVKLELLRLPLTKSGRRPRGSSYRNSHYVRMIIGDLQNLQGIFTSLVGTIATVWVVFSRVGWLAFLPMAISTAFSMVESALIRFGGHRYTWEEDDDDYTYDAKVDEVCLGIKTIKLFGWERMYLDPKLQQDNTVKKKLPWYAPVMRATWYIFDSLQMLTSQLSSFLTIYLHLQTASGAANPVTNAELFELSSHGDSMQSSITGMFYQIQRLRTLFKYNRTLENALRGDYISALPQEDVDSSSKVSIRMDACSFRWRKKRLTLTDVSLSVGAGELVAVTGKTASGKSSLLLAMCSEMEMTQGSGQVRGTVSYLEQTPWIMSSTLRDNILFGREFDEGHYWRVLYACAFMDDLEVWPNRDLTVIGERGINLSGGQRARLALARAVYSRADIYVFDDPLSAVDAVVKRHILDNVILSTGLLGDKVRVLATHAEGILPFCNQVITVDSGNVSVAVKTPREYTKSAVPDSPSCDSDKSSVTAVNDDDEPSLTPSAPSDDSDSDDDSDKSSNSDGGDKLVRKFSNRENAAYILRMCGLPVLASMLFSGMFSPVSSYILDGLQLDALRANSQSGVANTGAVLSYLKMHFLSRVIGTAVGRAESYIRRTIDERYLNDEIKISFVDSLIHAPLSFFDSTNRHQISTAYNDGADVVSGGVPRFLMNEFSTALETGLSIYRVACTAPQLLIISPLIAWAVVKRDRFVDPTTRSLQKISRDSRVRRNRASDLIVGAERMIRLYGVEAHFTELHIESIDEEARLSQPTGALSALSSHMHRFIYDFGDLLMTFSMLLQSQTTIYRVTSGDLITCKRLMNTLISNIGNVVNLPSRVLQFSDNIDIYRQYTDIPPEAPYVIEDCRPEPEWPRNGAIQMRNYTMRYAEGLKPALNNINLDIRPGEKIGIVGRTGAGKSTLAKALFRLANGPGSNGSIVIDGQNIEEIGVGDLRPRLGIIPQESTMFTGTVRQNLDPLLEFTVEDMWASLIKCDIAKIVAPKRKTPDSPAEDSDDDDDDDDEQLEIKERWDRSGWLMRLVLMALDEMPATNDDDYCPATGLNRYIYNEDYRFSNGQQQLFSLCRLLMRRRQIVVLDEATADVDLETDRSIQELIRKEFRDCTVLTIAHRLDTVKNSDRIIVMDKGEIAEIGTPEELMKKDGLFALLVKTNDFGA